MQKGKSQNIGYKKTKHAKFSEKQTFLLLDTHTSYEGVKKYPVF